MLLAGASPAWAGEVGPDFRDTAEFHRWNSVVPRPLEAQMQPELWTLGPAVLVDWGHVSGAEKAALSDRLDRIWFPLGRQWREARPPETPQLSFGTSGPGGEGYILSVSPREASVQARDAPGRFYALTTLTQLLPEAALSSEPVSAGTGTIVDAPAYGWRGLMLDSARHFQSVETLEWVLELMARHKLNRFHWHLTDDQGWRVPVPGWPRLTEVGAWRVEADGRRYGGHYTAEEIRHVVAFAAQRHIVVVPEVDLPGHASAALAAYPELSATGAAREVPLEWGVADGVLSLGRASVVRFTSDVLAALVALFPGPWIHWGGDEVYRSPWNRNAESLAWMKKVKASTPEEAVAAFWNDLAAQTLAAGKVPIGWDEVALHKPPAGTLVQWWDDPARALKALEAGYSVIASWKDVSYLDYPELDSDGDRAFWMPVQTLDTVASQPFWPDGTPERIRSRIAGVEAGLWTERAPEPKLGRKLFPRLSLVAELAWTGVRGGAPGWQDRISRHRERLEAWGVGMPPELR